MTGAVILSWLLRHVLAPLVIGVSAYFYGEHMGTKLCEGSHLAAQAKVDAKQDADVQTAQAQDAVAAAKTVERQTITREIYRDVPRIVDRPIYRGSCIDAAGVSLLQRAADAANGDGSPSRPNDNAPQVQPSARLEQPANGRSRDEGR